MQKSFQKYPYGLLFFVVLGGMILTPLALADTPIPGPSMSANFNASTGILSVSGTYDWPSRGCDDSAKRIGYAFFINGASPDNPGGGSLDGIGTFTMHLVSSTSCQNSGSWSDSHSVATAPSKVCAVMYDVRTYDLGKTSGKNNIPAGSNRNSDNSYEENGNTYSGNSCAVPTVVQPPQQPTADIKANSSDGPVSISYNTSATISWTSANATSCTVSPTGWSGVSGSQSSGALTSSQTYSLSCTGPGGSASDSVTVTVQAQQLPPTVSIVANPSTINQGNSSILTWNSSYAASCTASNAWSGGKSLSGNQTVTPTQTSTYVITCSNFAGQATDSATVTVIQNQQAPPPTVSIVANPSTVNQGNSSILNWTSTNATSCTASNGWTGTKVVSGNQTVSPSQTTTYVITCSNSVGQATDSAMVTVIQNQPPPPPTVSIISNPSTISAGNSSILTWNSSNATSCTASNGWSGTKVLSGTQSVAPTQTTTYTITCPNSVGQATDSTTITVVQNQQLPPTVSIVANPSTINQGNSSILTWNSSYAASCTASNAWSGGKSLSGNQTVTPTQTSTYVITCSNFAGQATDSATVTVIQNQQAPTADIKANSSDGPVSISYNTSATISWTSANATSCTVSPTGWSGVSGSQSSGALTSSQTYSLSCTGPGGSASDSVTVTVQAQQLPPTVSLIANPSYINQGNSSVLTWNSNNATSCFASNGWSGTKSLSGTESVVPAQTTVYTVTCSNSVGQASDTATITVVQSQPLPTVTLSANPSSINQGGSSVLTWSSNNATSCYASGGWSGTKTLSGSEVVYPNLTTSYTIVCSNSVGQAVDSETVSVQNNLAPPTVNLTANPTSINQGRSSVLSWTSVNAASCSAGGGWSGIKSIYGNETVAPNQTTTYVITCTGNGGSASDVETVVVNNSGSTIFQATKLVRNITLHETAYSFSTEGQGLDILEFEIRIKNPSGSQSGIVTVRDDLPFELSYIQGSTHMGGTSVADGITTGGLNIGTMYPSEEKVITFQAVVLSGTSQKFIRNTVSVLVSGSTVQTAGATIQVRTRGQVLGAATIVTGPENPLPWVLFGGFILSLFCYLVIFKYRYNGIATFSSGLADAKLQLKLWAIRRKERYPDTEIL